MEPSIKIVSIEKEIKFKKSDLEPFKESIDDDFFESEEYRLCPISNVKYSILFYPNGDEEEHRGQVWIYFFLDIGNATKIEAEIEMKSAKFLLKDDDQLIREESEGWGDQICKTEEFFDPNQNYFVIDEMIIEVKGTLKIYLPTNKIAYPISAHWVIKKSDLEEIKISTDDEKNGLLSKKIKFSNVICQLVLCPNGDAEHQRNETWLFFSLHSKSNLKINSVIYFSIDSANFSFDFEQLFEESEGWGSKICSTEDLLKPENQYFVDEEMTIKVSGTLLIDKEKENSTSVEDGTDKNDIPANDEKDFSIVVEEKVIKVHKQLLIDSSLYFIGLFNSGMIESIEMKTTITDFEYEIVEAGIQILYDPKIPSNFSFEQMLSLLQFSDKYDIQIIKNLIQNNLIENISPTNVCPLINFTATIVSAPKLYSKCVEFIVKCSKKSIAVHGLETLDKELMAKIFMQTFSKAL